MKLLIVISQMQCGGAERVVYHLYQQLPQFNCEIKLVVLGKIDYEIFHKLENKNVFILPNSDFKGKFNSNYHRIRFIRGSIKAYQPDLILSFIDTTNILTLLASRFLKIPVIISERNNPDKANISYYWKVLRKMTYPLATSLLVANQGMKNLCLKRFKIKCIDIVPNLMHLKNINRARINRIIAVGSLTRQKRFDILIDTMALLKKANKLNGFKLNIFGDGPLYNNLKEQIHKNNVADVVHLRGQTSNIAHEYASSKIFVLSSDYEGQPNVLLEAMNSGLACIATRCDFGPEEITQNESNGLLVNVGDNEGLAKAIEKLIHCRNLREELGENAKNTINKEFSPEVVIQKWLKLLNGLVKNENQRITFQ